MSTSIRWAAVVAAASRAAFSRRQLCHGPAKYVERPASSSRTAFVTASRNQRSCATRRTAAELLLGCGQVGGAREDVVAQARGALGGRALVVEGDAGALGHRDRAAVELGFAVQEAEQRRLAGAVRAGERDAVAALDLERDA